MVPLSESQNCQIPFFASLEFVFYVGWLKVAETLVNPFGEDDDDFDTNFLVDRNIQHCFLLIDQVGRYPPELEKDKFWESSVPTELPYTVASLPFRTETPPLTINNRGNDAPIYLTKQKETDGLKKYPSINSVISSVMRKISIQSVDGPNITRHGTIQEGPGLNFPRFTIPGTIQELNETDSPLVRSKETRSFKGSFQTPPAIQRIKGGHRKVKTHLILIHG